MDTVTLLQNHARMDGEEQEEEKKRKETTMVIKQQEAAAVPSRKTEAAVPNADESQHPKLTVWDRYVVHGLIDKGTFSTVSLATLRSEQHMPPDARRQYAIKLITQTSHPARIEREIRCMRTIGGQCNVVGLVGGFRFQGSVALVMHYIPQEPFHQYYARLTPAEVQRYLQQLLIALERVHLHGVIHRDVKPSNFLHSPRHTGTYVLVDFGLAQETDQGVLSLRPPCDGHGKTEAVKRENAVPVRNALKRQADGNTSQPLKLSNSTSKDLAGASSAAGLKHHRRSTVLDNRSAYAKDLKSGGGSGSVSAAGATSRQASSNLPACNCYGRSQVCNRCLVKPEMNAPRAGTPGYRPPEVLLKYPHQTTAVDIWAAGVIFLSLLSKCYPFFDNVDDLTSLAHMIEVFGFERMRETARALDRTLQCDPETMSKRPFSLRRVCQHFRAIHHRREMGSEAGVGDGGAGGAGGSSPPSGRDEDHFCCDNCCKPLDSCLCQRRRRAGVADGDDDEAIGDTDCDEYGPDAYELLERLLETNPLRRITATEALQHPYFQVQY
uniref:non-specific serine/threonine protein kinase n=1 Tax=Anopheles epiroticus TaxID=199890 RepID=A0A182PNC0_9DIPT